MRLGILATHPIQYHARLYRELAARVDLHVYFAHRQTARGQADAGFGVEFEWDVPLTDGYDHSFLENRASSPSTDTFRGCDTPGVAREIAKGSFDAFLVSGWYNKSYLQAMRACRQSKVPLFVRGDSHLGTPRSAARRFAKEIAYRRLMRRFDRCLYVGENSRAYFEHYGVKADRLHFSPHHVDNAWFRERAGQADREELRRRFGILPDAFVVLFAGKFIPVKQVDVLIRAAGELASGGTEAHLLLVGSGPLEDELRSLAGGLEVKATFAGFMNQSELPEAFAAADVVVLPSESETWGLVVNEGMACGLPAIVSDAVGCAPDLIDEGTTGFTFPVGDVAALAQRLQQVASFRGCERTQKALQDKMGVYSVSRAADGIINAMEAERG